MAAYKVLAAGLAVVAATHPKGSRPTPPPSTYRIPHAGLLAPARPRVFRPLWRRGSASSRFLASSALSYATASVSARAQRQQQHDPHHFTLSIARASREKARTASRKSLHVREPPPQPQRHALLEAQCAAEPRWWTAAVFPAPAWRRALR